MSNRNKIIRYPDNHTRKPKYDVKIENQNIEHCDAEAFMQMDDIFFEKKKENSLRTCSSGLQTKIGRVRVLTCWLNL